MEKYNYEEWQKISKQLNQTKQNLQQLSKLFIVTHEKVKQILRKCQTDLNYDPTSEIQKQVYFIKMILEKMANRQNDEYLSQIDPEILDKYQKHFQGLLQLMRLALITQSSKQSVNFNELKGISQKKVTNNQFGLQSEIKKSNERMMRTKSGHRITKNKIVSKEHQEQLKKQYENLIQQKDDRLRNTDDQKAHIQKFNDKKLKLQKIIEQQIQKQGLSLNFKNKYLNLDAYLHQRKQFADLLFCQQYFDSMIQEGQSRKNQAKEIHRKDPDLNKLFPQFNIKTKYLKKQVKQKIIQVIFDVKKQLLKQYHQANVARMEQAKQSGLGPLKIQDKTISNDRGLITSNKMKYQKRRLSSQDSKYQQRYQSTNRLMGSERNDIRTSSSYRKQFPVSMISNPMMRQTMYSMKNLKTTAKSTQNVKNSEFWPQQISNKTRDKVISRIEQGKFCKYGYNTNQQKKSQKQYIN